MESEGIASTFKPSDWSGTTLGIVAVAILLIAITYEYAPAIGGLLILLTVYILIAKGMEQGNIPRLR